MCTAGHPKLDAKNSEPGAGGNAKDLAQGSNEGDVDGHRTAGADAEVKTRPDSPAQVAPLLYLLPADVLTTACCMLDPKSLALASGVCRTMRSICQGSYPWKLLCEEQWDYALRGNEDEPQEELHRSYVDNIFGGDFHRLFPLIEPFPRGFDCSSLDTVRVQSAAERRSGSSSARTRFTGEDGRVSRGMEEVGDFWVKTKASSTRGKTLCDRGTHADRVSVLQGSVATEVEYRGGLGIGNRCIRTDSPLPSTVLRDRKSLAAQAHLARHLAASPLALFKWFFAKMASTAAGSGGPLACTRLHQNEVEHIGELTGNGGGHEDVASAGHQRTISTGDFMERDSSSQAIGGHHHGHEQPFSRPFCFPFAMSPRMYNITPRLVSYFEVAIGLPRRETPHAIPDCIAVGLSQSQFPLHGKMPGWDSFSYGYHSDDGGAFHDAGSMLFECGPPFGAGDVVGCGLDYSGGDDSADIFFTLNGRWLGGAFHSVRGTFYPTVGIDSACPVRINVGSEPFVFDLALAGREGGQEAAARKAIARKDGSSGTDSTTGSSAPAKQTRRPGPVILRPFTSSNTVALAY